MSFVGAAALSGIAQIGNTMLSQYYNKKNMRDQAALEYAYAQQYALNSPKWNVQGLRAAGLNPILAVSNGVNMGANIPNITNSSPKADIDIPVVEALKASKETDIGQQNADAQTALAESNASRVEAQNELDAAKTGVEILKAEQIKNELKGKGYKNDVVNDISRGMQDAAEALKDRPFNSPSAQDSAAEYINFSPKSSNFSKDTFFGKVQARIDADNEVARITGKRFSEVIDMPDSVKAKILFESRKRSNKSKAFHIFTR